MMQFPARVCIDGNMPFAQEELKRCLTAMTSANIAADGYPFEISAGTGERESYRVTVTEERTRIESDSPRGAVYGTYALLEWLGAEFLAEDCEMFPHVTEWEPTQLSGAPDFAYRDVYWRNALNGRFALQCRLNSAKADITPEMGGRTRFFNYSHTFDELVPPQRWFDTHPEYFSMVDGKRQKEHSQLCLTNPEVLALCIAGVRRWMRENPDCRIFSVAQNDWYGNCQCEHCRAIDEREESAAGSMITFVNAVADAIREEFPQNRIHTFAYLHTRKAPRFIRPRDNVIVRLCSIECCRSHPIGQCSQGIGGIDVENNAADAFAETERSFVQDLTDWAKLTPHLYLWDYTTNFSNYLQPFPNLFVLAPNLRLFRSCGAEGVLEQGNYAPGKVSAFGALRTYLMSRLLWDADENPEKRIRQFIRGYYGHAAEQPVWECISMMEAAAAHSHMGIYDMPDAPYLEEKTLLAAEACLCRAIQTAETAEQRQRLEREALSFEYARLARLSMDVPDRAEQIDRFAAKLKALGIEEIFERRELAASVECMKQSRYAKERQQVPYACYRL